MNEKQKNYTLNEINGYKERINELWYRINRNALFAFCGTGIAISIFGMDKETANTITENFVGVVSAASVVYNATSAVRKIAESESLTHTVRMLEHELAMDELQEKPKVYTKNRTQLKIEQSK